MDMQAPIAGEGSSVPAEPLDLGPIEDLLYRATATHAPGRWVVLAGDEGRRVASQALIDVQNLIDFRGADGRRIDPDPVICRIEHGRSNFHDDAAFIASAPAMVRDLVAEVKRLRQGAAELSRTT